MDLWEQFCDKLEYFYKVPENKEFEKHIFTVLKEIFPLESCYIFYTEPENLKYSFNPKTDNLKEIQEPFIAEDLKYNDTIFGKLIITGTFEKHHKKFLKICSSIIANMIKDNEISQIMTMQAKVLQDSYTNIQKSEQLKTEFISNMSHELRTPLNSILGYSDLLSNEFVGTLNSKQKEYLNDIRVSGLHLLGMINEILDISKLESGLTQINKTEFKISSAVEEVINIIKPLLINKQQKLVKKYINYTISADYNKFQQILFNLLNNAIKYTPANGTIEIITTLKNKNLILTIKDNGIGISEENQEKIFEKFIQIGNEKNSTGLGLTITKKLIELHNWEIQLNSKENIGSEFNITIPFD